MTKNSVKDGVIEGSLGDAIVDERLAGAAGEIRGCRSREGAMGEIVHLPSFKPSSRLSVRPGTRDGAASDGKVCGGVSGRGVPVVEARRLITEAVALLSGSSKESERVAWILEDCVDLLPRVEAGRSETGSELADRALNERGAQGLDGARTKKGATCLPSPPARLTACVGLSFAEDDVPEMQRSEPTVLPKNTVLPKKA